jgi:hypothetical protein
MGRTLKATVSPIIVIRGNHASLWHIFFVRVVVAFCLLEQAVEVLFLLLRFGLLGAADLFVARTDSAPELGQRWALLTLDLVLALDAITGASETSMPPSSLSHFDF